jgi:hypothetical protein
LPHLRRHGSYLDPGGSLSLLPGIAVVLRGLVLNLLVVWLPLVTAGFVPLRVVYRKIGFATAYDGEVWLQPWVFAASAGVVFAIFAVVYSLYSGWRAEIHKDMPYRTRLNFERIAPYVLWALVGLLVFGSLPYVKGIIWQKVAADGIVGFVSAAVGLGLGLWSRMVPKGDAAESAKTWAGPVGAALVLWAIGLLAYSLSGFVFADGSTFPGTGACGGVCRVGGRGRLLRRPERNDVAPVLPGPPDGSIHAGRRWQRRSHWNTSLCRERRPAARDV